MGQVNRWLIASSVALAAVLTDVAAHAFPGRTVTRPSSAQLAAVAARTAHLSSHHSATSAKPLQPPTQVPQTDATTPPATTVQSTTTTEAAATTTAPVGTQTTTTQASAPAPVVTPAPAPVVAPTPVVSGGS
jgi:hypothetical protein